MSAPPKPAALELVGEVRDLFTLPELYLEVKKLIESNDASVNELGELILTDPAISARLLKFANSAFFGLSREIDTVTRAVTVLGTQLVHDIVLATSVIESCSRVSDTIDLRQFWADSAYCGVVARIVAQHCDVLDSERIFLEGLLRDIGHLVMIQQIPEQVAQAQAEARSAGRQVYDAEQALVGCHYGDVGQALMDDWKLPTSFGEVARYHVEPANSATAPLECAIVHIAHHITLAVSAGLDPARETLPIDPGAWEKTGLSSDTIASILEGADEAAAETRALFLEAA